MQKEFLSSGEAVGETKYGELTDAALEKLAKAQTLAIALSAAVRLTEAEASEAELSTSGNGIEAGIEGNAEADAEEPRPSRDRWG